MPKVMYQLTDRNLLALSINPKLPYHIRKLAQKILDDRNREARYVSMSQ